MAYSKGMSLLFKVLWNYKVAPKAGTAQNLKIINTCYLILEHMIYAGDGELSDLLWHHVLKTIDDFVSFFKISKHTCLTT